ncbi:MAG: hypothetical protein ABSC32_16490 [Steroidobacteraceae bacterium]
MMINGNDGPWIVNRLRFGGFAARRLQEFAQTRDLIDPQVGAVRAPEQFAFGSDGECELLATLWLYLTEMLNQFDGVSPAHASRQFAVQQILMEYRKLVMKMFAHWVFSREAGLSRSSAAPNDLSRRRAGHAPAGLS